MHLERTAVLALLTLLLAVAAVQQVAARTDSAEPDPRPGQATPAIRPPVVTYGEDVDPQTIDTVEWAVGRYVHAGLQLPDLHITVPTTCQGRAGAYVVGKGEIRLCSSGRKLVLHELAHAWDDHGQVDRSAFLAERGLDEWFEWDVADKHDSGGEQLAHLLAWGLMDIDTMAREMTEPGQPIDQQRRFLTHLEDLDAGEVHALFEEVTSVTAFELVARPQS